LRGKEKKVNVPLALKGFNQFKKGLSEKITSEKYQDAFDKMRL